MKGNKKTIFLRVIAMLLSVLMVGSVLLMALPLFAYAADESGDYLQYPISDYTPGTACYDPIPLLIIMINFDADGDGVDDNPDGSGYSNVKNNEKAEYGEQWCHTTEEDWVNGLFSFEGATLNSYYKYMSGGKFYWLPAEETYGTPNNGVISVTIDNVHPNCIEGSGQWVHCFNQIIEAADEYVDFSMYDKNGNGMLEKYELGLAFILGGAETSSGSTNMKEVFGFHAYYKDYDRNNEAFVDGVSVARSGFFGTGAISGGKPLTFGVFAHELGHYLGAPDLYDTTNSGNDVGYDYAVRALSMMASGSHGTNPAHFDPYVLSMFGFYNTTQVHADGEYTLYSKTSSEGTYNILKLTTPNPGEYFLIENRYASATSGILNFDGSGTHQGILIWHVDENIHAKTGMSCNDKADGYDPTLVVYAPRADIDADPTSVLQDGFAFSQTTRNENYNIFEAASYVFPVSETWYTSLTEEEAKLVENLKIEVTSEAGAEMTVKITGSYDLKVLPEWSCGEYEKTQNSFTVKGRLDTLNYSTLNSAVFTVANKATGEVVKTEPLNINSNYSFEVRCEGLTENTEYEYSISFDSSHGSGTYSKSTYTSSKPVEKTRATVTLVVNSDLHKTTTVKINVGEAFSTSIPLTKKGYIFGGWYTDEACTQAYEAAPLETADDFTLYAKWVEDAAQNTTVRPTKPDNTTTAPVVIPPDTNDNNGGISTTTIVIIVVAAVVVIGGGAAAAIMLGKNKKQ